MDEVMDYFKNSEKQSENSKISPKLKFYAYDANEDGKIVYEEFLLEPNWQRGYEKLKDLDLAQF